jgi:hypothetical protein
MKTPEWILDKVRTCLHSAIICNAKDLHPDYVCTLGKGEKAKPCFLLQEQAECHKREPFPERFNQ